VPFSFSHPKSTHILPYNTLPTFQLPSHLTHPPHTYQLSTIPSSFLIFFLLFSSSSNSFSFYYLFLILTLFNLSLIPLQLPYFLLFQITHCSLTILSQISFFSSLITKSLNPNLISLNISFFLSSSNTSKYLTHPASQSKSLFSPTQLYLLSSTLFPSYLLSNPINFIPSSFPSYIFNSSPSLILPKYNHYLYHQTLKGIAEPLSHNNTYAPYQFTHTSLTLSVTGLSDGFIPWPGISVGTSPIACYYCVMFDSAIVS
jgi:hypothetical protein